MFDRFELGIIAIALDFYLKAFSCDIFDDETKNFLNELYLKIIEMKSS
jgi:hypothetical protein